MIAIRAHFLTGKYVAADLATGAGRSRAEWPPHPARLFYALVDAWAALGRSAAGRRALEWLESQPGPTLRFSEAHHQPNRQTFVPVNDDIPKTGDESADFPFRVKKSRSFAAVVPFAPQVDFVWSATPESQVVQSLRDLCEATPRLGHSTSLVHLELTQETLNKSESHAVAVPLTEWVLQDDGKNVCRVPSPGRLAQLDETFTRSMNLSSAGDPKLVKKNPLLSPEPIPVAMPRPDYGTVARYGPQPTTRPLVSSFSRREWVIFRIAGPAIHVTRTLFITGLLRQAVLSHHGRLGGSEAPFLTGHAAGSTLELPAAATTPHLAYIPLPFVGADHADGHVVGLAVLVPDGLEIREQRHVRQVLGRIDTLTGGGRVWQLQRVNAHDGPWATRSERWTKPARQWATVTPLVLDRLLKPNVTIDSERVRNLVLSALERMGLEAPESLWIGPTSAHRGVPAIRDFQPPPGRLNGPSRRMVHVVAKWAEPVVGPLLAGSERHQGYGLFASLSDPAWRAVFDEQQTSQVANRLAIGAPPALAGLAPATDQDSASADEDDE